MDQHIPLLAPLNVLSYLTGVESRGFIESVESVLCGLVKGGKVKEAGEGYLFRKSAVPYGDHFEVENRKYSFKMPIFGTNMQNNQLDILTRHHNLSLMDYKCQMRLGC